MISAADVFTVATPSWKRKGLRSAKDLLPAVIDAASVKTDESDFAAASFTVLLLVSRRVLFVELSQDDDDVRLDSTRRHRVDVEVASMVTGDSRRAQAQKRKINNGGK